MHHINNFLRNCNSCYKLRVEKFHLWETQLNCFTYSDYNLDCERNIDLLEQLSALFENLKAKVLMEIPGTQQRSKSEKWFSERWCKLTASKPVFLHLKSVGKLVSESRPNANVEASKFISTDIWGLGSKDFPTYWIRFGLECES